MDHHGRQTLSSQEPAHLVVGRLLHLSIPHAPGQAFAILAGKPRDEDLVTRNRGNRLTFRGVVPNR